MSCASRGGSGALYLQSAVAEMMFLLRLQPLRSDLANWC